MMMMLFLNLSVVTLMVFVEESLIVAIWRQLCVMKFFVIVSNSLNVFWSINDVWIVWRLVIGRLESWRSMNALILALKLIPVSSVDSWDVPRTLGVIQISLITPSLRLLSHAKLTLMVTMLVMLLDLSIVTLVILVEEPFIVAIWRQFSVVEFLVIIANSLDILRSIDNIRVIR